MTDVKARPDLGAIKRALGERSSDLTDWLSEVAPECDQEQRHLDADTPERTYWLFGYLVALRDVLALIDGKKDRLH